MELRFAALALAAGIGVDTVRFCKARGLVPAADRRSRFAIYGRGLLDQALRIRALVEAGLPKGQGDGQWLALASASVDVMTCGWAPRDFVSIENVLREIVRFGPARILTGVRGPLVPVKGGGR